MNKTAALGQYFTPAWAPEFFYQHYYPALGAGDCVLDPACGDARFLLPLPAHVAAYGVDIDPAVVAQARRNTTREIIEGDFIGMALPQRPTLIIGNPPYNSKLISRFLDWSFEILDYGGQVGFILPAYYLQTASVVVGLSRQWSMRQDMLPRNLFENLTKPINFVRFVKDKRPVVVGFFLNAELDALETLKAEFREMFTGNTSKANVWLETLYAAMKICGGRARLSQIYSCIENRRPTANPWWREKIRQVAGQYMHRVEPGLYEIPGGFHGS